MGVINSSGQVVYNSEQQITGGNVSTSVDVSNLPSGVYVLKLLLAKKVYYSKIVIVR
jgi:hypothetical protein